MVMLNERTISILILILFVAFVFFIIRTFLRILKSIWRIITGKSRDNDYRNSKDWLIRAQARQEVRFENSLPPLQAEAKPLKKTFREKRNERKGKSATGWIFNEETQIWEPPKNMKR